MGKTQRVCDPGWGFAEGEGQPSIELLLPLPPSVNHQYLRRQDGRIFLHPAVREYREVVAAATIGRSVPPGSTVSLEAKVYTKRKRDIDNVLKVLIDALAAALGFDDGSIDRIQIEKQLVFDRKGENLTVKLTWNCPSSKQNDSK